MKEVFINELGNEVTIQVKKFDPLAETVYLAIYGPNSSVTNLITVKEAEVLCKLLTEELGNQARKAGVEVHVVDI